MNILGVISTFIALHLRFNPKQGPLQVNLHHKLYTKIITKYEVIIKFDFYNLTFSREFLLCLKIRKSNRDDNVTDVKKRVENL